jgi:hypothetical protein
MSSIARQGARRIPIRFRRVGAKTQISRQIETGGVSMKAKGIFTVVLSFLLLYLPAAPINASSAAGKMTTTGSAEINGVSAPAVTSVFVGDRIATQKQATTSLSFAGGDSVVLPELTQAALGQKDGRFVVNLQDGTVSVGNARLVGSHGPYKGRGNDAAVWDWLKLALGQTVLAKHRPELARMPENNLPRTERFGGRQCSPLQEPAMNQSDLFKHPVDSRIPPNDRQSSRVSQRSLDLLTDEAIKSTFDQAVIGRHLLELAERPDGLDLAVAYAAIVVKARRARLGAQIKKDSTSRRA